MKPKGADHQAGRIHTRCPYFGAVRPHAAVGRRVRGPASPRSGYVPGGRLRRQRPDAGLCRRAGGNGLPAVPMGLVPCRRRRDLPDGPFPVPGKRRFRKSAGLECPRNEFNHHGLWIGGRGVELHPVGVSDGLDTLVSSGLHDPRGRGL